MAGRPYPYFFPAIKLECPSLLFPDGHVKVNGGINFKICPYVNFDDRANFQLCRPVNFNGGINFQLYGYVNFDGGINFELCGYVNFYIGANFLKHTLYNTFWY
jgi:hypothetical protein